MATYQLTPLATTLINDVTLTKDGAWSTDSKQAQLYFIPINGNGALRQHSTLRLSGPAADLSGEFNLNGIAATADGKTLIVAHSSTGQLYTVDPASGDSAIIKGVSVPGVDGIVLDGQRLWAVLKTTSRWPPAAGWRQSRRQ